MENVSRLVRQGTLADYDSTYIISIKGGKKDFLIWPQNHPKNNFGGSRRLNNVETIEICLGTIDSKVKLPVIEGKKGADKGMPATPSDEPKLPVERSTNMERKTELW